jgi:hypothetical protein
MGEIHLSLLSPPQKIYWCPYKSRAMNLLQLHLCYKMIADPKPGYYLHSQMLLFGVRKTYHTYWSAKYNCPLRSWVYASTSEHCLWDSPKSALKFWKWINQNYTCSHMKLLISEKHWILMTWLVITWNIKLSLSDVWIKYMSHWRHMVEYLLNIYSKLSIICVWMFQVWTMGSYLLSYCAAPSDFLLYSFRNVIHHRGNPSLISTMSIISFRSEPALNCCFVE